MASRPQGQHLPCHPEASFPSRPAARIAINRFARRHGYAVVILRSINDRHGACRRVVFACDRHHSRRERPRRAGVQRRPNAPSRGCECEMRINLYRSACRTRWEIRYSGNETMHNHPPSLDPSSHPEHRQADMPPEVRAEIATDAQTGARAAQTFVRLVEANENTSVRPRDIYNERRRAEARQVGTRSRVEYLLEILGAGDYHVSHQLDPQHRLSHLFFALNEALDIYKDNYDVILMDCTYKTNRFGVPLLNIVGVTGMNTTIHLGQAFVPGEAFEDYQWALTQLRSTLTSMNTPLPQVVYTDRDLALLNALETAFPGVPVLLCLWHIVKHVESHARAHTFQQVLDKERSSPRQPKWKDSTAHRTFCDAFIDLTRAPTEAEYEARRQRLHELLPVEAAYIDDVWLDIWKRRIVRCWTSSVMHFGMQTTSRVEGYRAALKKWLQSSRGDLLSIYNKMVHWWRQSILNHRTLVSNTQIMSIAPLRIPMFRSVTTLIHNYALIKCRDQLELLSTNS